MIPLQSFLISVSVIPDRSHIKIAPAWCEIIDLMNCTSATAVWARMPRKKSSRAAKGHAAKNQVHFGVRNMPRITSNSMITIGAAMSPAT